MKTIDTSLLSELGASQLKPFALLDMKINNTHYRYTDCDTPIKNMGISVPDNSFQSGELGNDLGGYWNFLDGNGTTLADMANDAHDMTASANAPLWNPNGKRGWCGEFNGQDQYYSVASSSGDSLNPETEITVSCMVKVSNLNIPYQYIVAKGITYFLRIEEGGIVNFAVWTTGGIGYATSSAGAIEAEKWTQIVGTYDGSSGVEEIKLYINGSLVATDTTATTGSIDQTSQAFYLGSAAGLIIFSGLIDEVRIYDEKVLSATEVSTLYTYHGAAWEFDPEWHPCEVVSVPDWDTWGLTGTSLNSDGDLEFDGTTSANAMNTSIITTGKYYYVSWTVEDTPSAPNGTLKLSLGNRICSEDITEDGTYTFICTDSASTNAIFYTTDGFEGIITDFRFVPCAYCDGTQSPISWIRHNGIVRPNRLYKISYTIDEYDDTSDYSGDFKTYCGNAGYTSPSTDDGIYTVWQYAIGGISAELNEERRFLIYAGPGFKGVVKNLNVREVLWWTRDVENTELIDDGVFYYGDNSISPWDWDTGWSSPSAGLQADFDYGTDASLDQTNVLEYGNFYKVKWTLEDLDSDSTFKIYCGYGGGTGETFKCTEEGDYSIITKNDGSVPETFRVAGIGGSVGTIKNISVRKINSSDLTEVYNPRSMKIGTVQYSTKNIVDKVTIEITDLDDTLKGEFIGINNYDVQGDPVTLSFTILNEKNHPIISGNEIETEARIVLFQGEIDAWEYDETRIKITVTNMFANWARRTLSRQSGSCRWRLFGGTECGLTNTTGKECDRSYTACQGHNNTDNFGGFRYLPSIVDKEIWWGRVQAKPPTTYPGA